jgi:hypothetical protein
MATYKDGVFQILASIKRGKGSFNVSENPKPSVVRPFALTVGSVNRVEVPGGVFVSVDMSREQLEKLRGMCDELLGRRDLGGG